MKTISRVVGTIVAGLALTGLAAPLAAQDTSTVAVRVDDLNLASAAGMRAVEARIGAAARRVCGGTLDTRNLATNRRSDRCRLAAVADAMGVLQARNTPVYAAR